MNVNNSEMNSERRISDIIRKCYSDFIARDRKALEDLFTDDFTFHSPHDPHIDKSAYFEKCWPNGDNFRTFQIEKLFVHGNESFVRYECETKTGKKFRNTEYLKN